jgi:hypothetical protein
MVALCSLNVWAARDLWTSCQPAASAGVRHLRGDARAPLWDSLQTLVVSKVCPDLAAIIGPACTVMRRMPLQHRDVSFLSMLQAVVSQCNVYGNVYLPPGQTVAALFHIR